MSFYDPFGEYQATGRRERVAAARDSARRTARLGGCGLKMALAAIVIIILGVAWQRMEWGTEHNVTFTVQSLDDQASSSNGHKYLIFTTDGRVFADTDAWFHGKTDSSNVWDNFLRWGTGATVTCPVYGYRVTLTSSYPDVLDGCRLLKRGTPVASA